MKKKKIVSEEKTSPVAKKRSPGIFGAFLSGLLSLLLTATATLLVLLLFIYAINENVPIPTIGPFSGDSLTEFFESWYSLALGGALVLLPMLFIIIVNIHRIRRAFISIGISAILSALLSAVFGFISTQSINLLSGEWQDTLINATVVLKDFTVICAVVFVVIGAACLSIYSCINVVKGAKHEKIS